MGMMFGKDETIDCIVDVQLEGASQEALCLAHKHTKIFVVAGVWVRDDGYVLGVKGESKKFYDMPKQLTNESLRPTGPRRRSDRSADQEPSHTVRPWRGARAHARPARVSDRNVARAGRCSSTTPS